MPTSVPKLLLRGLDSLYVCYYLDVQRSDIDFDELAYRKESISESRNAEFGEIQLGNLEFALKPYGKYPYKYVLTNDKFRIHLSEHLKPSCYVQFLSSGLWLFGLDTMRGLFGDWCTSLNLIAEKEEVVSRADWSFDFELAEVDFEWENFLSKAAKGSQFREFAEIQTFAFGKGDVVVRIYDKVAEIAQQSEKAWFFELWGQIENVWRIEFQVRKERLRKAGIRTIDDLKEFQNDLLRELAHNHTSLRIPNGDSNRSRWPLHPLWKKLIQDIASLPQSGLVQDIDAQMPIEWRIYQQLKSIYGMLKGVGVLFHANGRLRDHFQLEDVIRLLEPQLKRHHHYPRVWNRDIQKRIRALQLGEW